ncbi:[protein-PII] uridylyltransferase [Natronocella acetinitrilica]|uniref:Bifunctional uridylyltransferase/uridylyl-removing enzyme n=1 Tax=Natronocella acetinitrilica TaxID=414046 RepID=A0AAE3KCV9_9GAMM|nr:[protein-PII] uridylyltransferase [Natronocella acetinitrilica]MCP1676144.1 [protein-PII] uridylyltransferase [Natronocella acetinitrilica]
MAIVHADVDALLFDPTDLDARLAAGTAPVKAFRHCLEAGDAMLEGRFREGTPARLVVPQRSWLIDQVLGRAWQRLMDGETGNAALVAVGGYGRGELHPGSDIDIMVLIPADCGKDLSSRIERFITSLWDIGLEVGHSVRTVEDCVRESTADITVATNIMESRLLAGAETLFDDMREATAPAHVWASRDFFAAKLAEQEARHLKYHDTAHNLEPNIKESPGGLRDIQMVGWVAKRHFGAETLRDLVGQGFLNESEYEELISGQNFLWDIRFALHLLAGRREDRLLFDHQTALAKQFGYADQDHTLGVEQLMQRYFRTVADLGRLNEMLLQLFQEAILYVDDVEPPQLLNKRFQARKGFLEVTHGNVFKRYPFALLEAFLLMQQHPELKGVRASTIRLIRDSRHLIDDKFRRDLRCRSLFMEIMRQPRGLTHELRRMHRYGVLARYIPAFGAISGRMQYDLFHAYTVDSHTLFVVRNLRRFAIDEHADELPFCNTIMQRLPKTELLYLAGIFHDIAKGRGGDHSELGADDAYEFCIHHGLSQYDARLVAWLVRHHLLMSMTAQRKDISDPEVVSRFARQVGDRVRLDYLYLLTVADIRATNPGLWNSWRDSLLMELYTATTRALRRGLEHPIDNEELVRETQQQARRRLKVMGLHHMSVKSIWRHFTDDYFLRYSAEEIAWHTEAIARTRPEELPLVLVDAQSARGGTEVFVYTEDRDHVFAQTVQALDQLNLNIQDARIITTEHGHTLDSYLVLEDDGEPARETWRIDEIAGRLQAALQQTRLCPPARRPVPRQLRSFTIKTEINFSPDETNERTVMELITGDRPGLLARVGYGFAQCGFRLQNAKIATIGARVEDVFFVTDEDNRPLSRPEQFDCIRDALIDLLDERSNLAERATGL